MNYKNLKATRVWTAIFVILLVSLTLAEESSILEGATVTNIETDFKTNLTPNRNVLIGNGFRTLVATDNSDGYQTDGSKEIKI